MDTTREHIFSEWLGKEPSIFTLAIPDSGMGISFSGLQDVFEPLSNLCLGMAGLRCNVVVVHLEMTKTKKGNYQPAGA